MSLGIPSSRVPRAEFILAAAIALVSLLVVALVFALRAEDPAHARTLQTIAMARTVRNETLALTQAMADAESAVGDLLTNGAGALARRAAMDDARGHTAALRSAFTHDSELARLAERIEFGVEAEFAYTDAVLAHAPTTSENTGQALAQLRIAVADLIAAVNRRNDSARNAENRLRARLDAIAVALAGLSLIASGLAIFALRRERGQWRLANALAEGARASAAASDLAKTRFLTAASHDMRQPLHALTLYLSALDRRIEGDEARGILSKAERAAQSLAGMFGVLLDLARIEANVITPELGDVRLQDIFDRMVSENPGADVAAQMTPLHVRSDPILLERIVRNLVSNALRHGGGNARLEARAHGVSVDIVVRDNGPGIAANDQARIFDEFVRLEGGGASEGLGLGLAIVKRLAGLMGHAIELRSAAEQGAAFTVRAPLLNAGEKVSARAPATSLDGLNALVMDDDQFAREAMAGALRDMGARVTACATEAEFDAAIIGPARPHLLVLDLRVDGRLVGIDIANRVAPRLDRSARIVIVTGDTGADTLATLRASGYRWLVKPVDPRELAATLSSSRRD